ncbi:DUF2630 family protein [Streptomyces phaeofaciens JCM 4814]|jgi:hypothetical protein|uniref:DUF2630 family protein n=1 Tax=Streptomyces phaeofaciens TaxID=68254 RepID=A0A918M0E6_9ACTN|nr:DUF2630 family protein [Streptomyces phaeofaciens]GGT92938.1 hypothetical protein GCM10010226_83490 [Streptomyces phaeofaciens]
METDQHILHRIAEMADEERRLRDALTASGTDTSAERARLGAIERELDQCWDLLRQRRAREEFGQDPDEAHVRPQSQVEKYQS